MLNCEKKIFVSVNFMFILEFLSIISRFKLVILYSLRLLSSFFSLLFLATTQTTGTKKVKLNKDAKSLIEILEKARGVQERLAPLKVCYVCLRTLEI